MKIIPLTLTLSPRGEVKSNKVLSLDGRMSG